MGKNGMARSLGLEATFINIDFEKAYDRVEWPFILVMLKVTGFGLRPYQIHPPPSLAGGQLVNGHFDDDSFFTILKEK
jgi:hypothetical protein